MTVVDYLKRGDSSSEALVANRVERIAMGPAGSCLLAADGPAGISSCFKAGCLGIVLAIAKEPAVASFNSCSTIEGLETVEKRE